MNGSWIKLYRDFQEWEWFQSSNHVKFFIYLMMSANHKPKKWKGIEIGRGQLLTGRKALSQKCNLSEQQVRTILKDLKSTNEITIKSTKRYSIITVTNYEKYQESNHQTNQHLTNNQPTLNQHLTTNKKDKNEKNEKNERYIYILPNFSPLKLIDFYNTKVAIPNNLKSCPHHLTEGHLEQISKLEGHPELQSEKAWSNYFKKIGQSKFLTKEKRPTLDFPWTINPDNASKVLMGRYDNSPSEIKQPKLSQEEIDQLTDFEKKELGYA